MRVPWLSKNRFQFCQYVVCVCHTVFFKVPPCFIGCQDKWSGVGNEVVKVVVKWSFHKAYKILSIKALFPYLMSLTRSMLCSTFCRAMSLNLGVLWCNKHLTKTRHFQSLELIHTYVAPCTLVCRNKTSSGLCIKGLLVGTESTYTPKLIMKTSITPCTSWVRVAWRSLRHLVFFVLTVNVHDVTFL